MFVFTREEGERDQRKRVWSSEPGMRSLDVSWSRVNVAGRCSECAQLQSSQRTLGRQIRGDVYET